MNGWMNEWMDNKWAILFCWATSSLSDIFAEVPLLSAASSLSSLLSGLLLLWLSCLPATSMRLAASSCNPEKHKVALWSKTTFRAAVKMRLAASSCNRASHASQHHSAVAACSRANAFWNSWLQTPIAPRWIDQRSRSEDKGDNSALLRDWRFLAIFMWNRALAAVWCTFRRLQIPKVLRARQFFNNLKWKSLL